MHEPGRLFFSSYGNINEPKALFGAGTESGAYSSRHAQPPHHQPPGFGSVIHGTDTESSDLDLLVDPLPGATLFDLGAIQIELETVLGVAVDVLTPKDLPTKFREQVLGEAIPV